MLAFLSTCLRPYLLRAEEDHHVNVLCALFERCGEDLSADEYGPITSMLLRICLGERPDTDPELIRWYEDPEIMVDLWTVRVHEHCRVVEGFTTRECVEADTPRHWAIRARLHHRIAAAYFTKYNVPWSVQARISVPALGEMLRYQDRVEHSLQTKERRGALLSLGFRPTSIIKQEEKDRRRAEEEQLMEERRRRSFSRLRERSGVY